MQLLFEFLSFDEFKFVKMWEDWDADMKMMRPVGAWRPSAAGATFFGRVCAICETIYAVSV
jgi:hypothetical protein